MSGDGASFVKKGRPRSSASRISSTYDDVEDTEAGLSHSSIRPTSNGVPASATSQRNVSTADIGDEEEAAGGSSVVFRSRAKGAKAAASTSSTASNRKTGSDSASEVKQRSLASAMVEDDDEHDTDMLEVRRSRPSTAVKQAGRSATGASSLASTSTETQRRSTPLRPTSFQSIPADTPEASSSTTPNLYTSKYLEELRYSTPTSRSRAQTPTASPHIGPGKRIDDPMVAQTSRLALDDDSLARSKFAADFAHDPIPSESVIRAAKEKRAKLRAAASTSASSSDDFISLAPFSKPSSALKRYDAMEVDTGPHPHSRLQREEDEIGDGEEEFAEFTGATERIPIGEKAEREWNEVQRREMEAAVRGDFDQDGVEDEMDEDEEKWERAQLRRTQMQTGSVSQGASREASPYRAAPIPAAAPLPSVSTCSTRFELTLRALEQSTAASAAVVESSMKELETLEAAEEENKLDVAAVEEKASWFNELDEFVVSLARFMEEKMERVEEVEKQALDLVVKRNSMLSQKLARWLDQKLEASLGDHLTTSAVIRLGVEQSDVPTQPPNSDALTTPTDALQMDTLSAADALSYTHAQREIVLSLNAIFSDVQAPEYLDPSALTSSAPPEPGLPFFNAGNPPHGDEQLHPRSVVSRFEEWRRRYPDEYAQVWGGLSVAQIWEFYARLELIPFSALCRSVPLESEEMTVWMEGARAIVDMQWLKGAFGYTREASASSETVFGGDDEVVSTIMANVVVEHLIKLAREGAFSPWSEEQAREAVAAVDVVRFYLGEKHVRVESLVEAYLDVYRRQIERLKELAGVAPQVSHADRGKAAEEVAEALVERLLKNLLTWAGAVILDSAHDAVAGGSVIAKTLVGLVETLVLGIVEVFAARTTSGPGETRRKVFDMLPPHLVSRSERLTLLSQQL